MEGNTEADQFRRIQLNSDIDRARGIIADYRVNIDFYRKKIEVCFEKIGRIAERLGEPEDKED